jgi:NADP-dependent 3-hydroxy acid dehydrogenase YdfG
MREYDRPHDRVALARNCSAPQTSIHPPSGAVAIPAKGSPSAQRSNSGAAGIITGAATGIGAATALAFGRLGARMILAGIATRGTDRLVKSIVRSGGSAIPFACDVRDPSQVKALADLAVTSFGRIDFLVASAGIALQDRVVSGDVTRWRDVVETNLLGLAHSVRFVLPQMHKQRSGHIFLIASQSGRHAYQGEAIYIASKWGVVGFGHAVRMEEQAAGIKVTIIEPGLVDTPLTRDNPNVRPLLDAFTPLKAEDVAAAIVYAYSQPPHVNVNELALRPLGQGEDPFRDRSPAQKKRGSGRRG